MGTWCPGSTRNLRKKDYAIVALVYATYLGGKGVDWGIAIAVDTAGNAYLTGLTAEDLTTLNTFPVVNAFQPTYGGDTGLPSEKNAFVAKLNATGSALIYSSYLGGSGGPSSFFADAFVAKLTPEGALVYSSHLGGNFEDSGNGIALDASGNVDVTGITSSGDFPVTFDAFQPENKAGGCTYPFTCADAFMTKISD